MLYLGGFPVLVLVGIHTSATSGAPKIGVHSWSPMSTLSTGQRYHLSGQPVLSKLASSASHSSLMPAESLIFGTPPSKSSRKWSPLITLLASALRTCL